MSELIVVSVLLPVAGSGVGIIIGLWFWANAMARKHPRRLYQRARYLPRIGSALLVVGMLMITVGLVRSFNEVAFAEPASKATMLAHGISTAMNYGAAPVALSMLCLVLSGLISLAGTLQRGNS